MTDFPTGSAPSSVMPGFMSVRTGVCVITFFCGGDLSGVRVNLEQKDVVFVGDLADQAVAQMGVGGLWVVLIQRKHAGKWGTCNRRQN